MATENASAAAMHVMCVGTADTASRAAIRETLTSMKGQFGADRMAVLIEPGKFGALVNVIAKAEVGGMKTKEARAGWRNGGPNNPRTGAASLARPAPALVQGFSVEDLRLNLETHKPFVVACFLPKSHAAYAAAHDIIERYSRPNGISTIFVE